MSTRVNQHRVSVDNRVSVRSGTRIFRRHVIVCHACIGEHGTNSKFVAIFVRRIMTLDNIAVEPRTIIDTQHTVHTAYHAADNAANDRSHGTSIVLTDTSAMISALWYALSVRSGRHCERQAADDYDVSNYVYLWF